MFVPYSEGTGEPSLFVIARMSVLSCHTEGNYQDVDDAPQAKASPFHLHVHICVS